MGCADYGGITVVGNFAEVLPEKPKDFDYMTEAKWLEPYPFDVREKIGGTVCSCEKVEWWHNVYFEPDVFHLPSCNLMKKVRAEPHLTNLWAYEHLPRIAFSKQSVPASTKPSIYIAGRSARTRVKVRRMLHQPPLPLFSL